MNIFILDLDHYNNAVYHCDQHVGKMVLESGQLLSTAFPNPKAIGLYEKTHYNHPCAKWVRESKSNYDYLIELMDALGDEFRYRYDKQHESHTLVPKFRSLNPKLKDEGLSSFALAMPDKYKHKCPVQSYRFYYPTKLEDFDMTWKRRRTPNWFKELVS
jgi:hypothetical protein